MSSPQRVTVASVLEEQKRLSAQSAMTAQTRSTAANDRRSSAQSYTSGHTFGEFDHAEMETLVSAVPYPRLVDSEQRSFVQSVPSSQMPANLPGPRSVPEAGPSPLISSTMPKQPITSIDAARVPGLNKNKTKSKVWGFLGRRHKIKEEDKQGESPFCVCRNMTKLTLQ